MNIDGDHNALFDDDEDDEIFGSWESIRQSAVLAASFVFLTRKKQRFNNYVRDRLEWNLHVQQLFEESPTAFSRMYRMSLESFNKLLSLLFSTRNATKYVNKLKIPPEIILHCLLWWLAEGSYLDVCLTAGISVPSFYRLLYGCVDLILESEELEYKFPTDFEEATENFTAISLNSAIQGCVATIDGFLLQIQTPSNNECNNVKAFYSGHYSTYGINVQAACDYRSRFVSVCVAGPGGINDIVAFRKTELAKIINNMPIGFYIIGDCAYSCTEHLLTPFAGNERLEPKCDAYNFYLSQLRIRIEMAFGLLTQKWCILQRPMKVKLKNAGRVFICLTRLHNFCIEEGDESTPNPEQEGGAIPEGTTADTARGYLPLDVSVSAVVGSSVMRDRLVEYIHTQGLIRNL